MNFKRFRHWLNLSRHREPHWRVMPTLVGFGLALFFYLDALHFAKDRSLVALGLAGVLAFGVLLAWQLVKLFYDKQARVETENERLIRKLKDNQHALDMMGIGVLWVDSATATILSISPAWANKLGYQVDELLLQNLQKINPNLTVQRYQTLRNLLMEKHFISFEATHLSKQGKTIPVEIDIHYQPARNGVPDKHVAFVRDISERQATIEQIRQFNNSLEQRVAARTAELEAEKQALAANREALAQISGRLSTLFAMARDGIHLLDEDGNLIECSDSFAQMLGYSVAEAQQLNVADWEAVVPKQALKSKIQQILEHPCTFETRHRRKDGSEFDVEINAGGIDIAGTRFVYASSRDISERKRLKAILQASNDRLEATAYAGIIGIWDWDVINDNLYWDRGMYRLYGISDEDFSGVYDAWANALHPEDKQQAFITIKTAMNGSPEYSTEFRIIRPDGATRYIHSTAKITYDAGGKPLRMIGVNYDITEHKQLEHALRASLKKNEAILNSQIAGFWITVDQRMFQWVNQTAAESLGYTTGELIGQSARICYPDPESYQRFGSLTQEAFSAGKEFHVQYQWQHKNGSLRWFDITAVPIPSEPGTTVWISVDIDAAKQAEAQMLLAKQAAEKANEAKSAFLAMMSHEIRTPLNAIVGMSYLLSLTALDQEQQEAVKAIESSSQNLLALINDILDFSKIEAGEFYLDNQAFRLADIFSSLRDMFAAIASQKGIEFTVDVPDAELPVQVIADANRLKQMLINLISNAIKFTGRGGRVGLSVNQLGRDASDRSVRLRFAVTDTGIGLSAEVIDKLFKPFIQADIATSRKYGGTGLGLAIVKKLARLMNGEVGVDSRPGVGSIFWLELPFQLPETAGLPSLPSLEGSELQASVGANLNLTGMRIVAVDDSHLNLEVIKRILGKAGATVSVCDSGQKAVSMLREQVDDFDLVLMDIQMPDMDGIDAARIIRQTLNLSRLPIVALTAGVTTTQRQLAQSAGMNEILSKPVEPVMLLAVLHKYLKNISSPPPMADAVPGNWPVISGINTAQARLLTGNDRALYVELLKLFIGENQHTAESITATIQTRQVAQAVRLTHKLCGQAANIAATALAAAAGQLEQSLNAGELAEDSFSLLESVNMHLAALQAAIIQCLNNSVE